VTKEGLTEAEADQYLQVLRIEEGSCFLLCLQQF
jgi:hypothetical protein